MYAAHVLLIHHGRVICHAQNPQARPVPGPRPLPVRRPQGALTDGPVHDPETHRDQPASSTPRSRDLLDADFAASPVAASGYGLTEYDDAARRPVRRRVPRAATRTRQAFLGRLERIGDVAPDGSC